MSKERLKQFKNSLDFLDDSADMEDYHRLIDTLENLYKDGELDWIHRLASKQSGRVQELEDIKDEYMKSHHEELKINDKLTEQNGRYREAMEKALTEGEFEDVHTQLERMITELSNALEGDPHD